VEPSRLIIEITEDVVVDDTIRSTIDALRQVGVGMAIDDFGTGNSSLRQLGSYPADTLKIDRSFVSGLGHDERATMVVKAILGLARNLGLRTVAEGVETAEQAELLTALGCDLAQGWYFAKALEVDEFEAYFRSIDLPFNRAGQLPSRPIATAASSMIRPSSSATGGRSVIAPTT
jgi:diguanylate cyclase